MEKPQDSSDTAISTNKTNSSSTNKSNLPSNPLRPGPGKRLPWESLKVEYLNGQIADVAEWGKVKGIAYDTLKKNTVGWPEEYRQRQAEIAKAALAKSFGKQVKSATLRSRAGRILVTRCIREFEKRKLGKVATKELASMVKIGSDIQASVEDQTTQEAIEKLQDQVTGTQVTITQGKGEDEVRTEIKILARNLSGSRVDRLGRRSAVLGPGQYPDGEQPTV